MDRRTYTFVVASAAFLFFYLSLRAVVAPPQPEEKPVADQPVQAAEDAGEDAQQTTDPAVATSEEVLGTSAEDAETDSGIESTKTATKWYSIGSMDPAEKQNLMITFSNRGAGIERIELTARGKDGSLAYRRVDTRSGYLGYFAGEPSVDLDGVVVNVVGSGTPAAVAVATTGERESASVT